MPETRDTKQYKVYVLHANIEVVLGKRNDKEVTRTDRVPLAVFDDKKLCDKFQKENENKAKGQTGYEVVEEWREVEPVEGVFGLPFNPKPNTIELQAKKSKSNGTD